MFVDTHCHIDFAPPEERGGMITRANAAGVGMMLCVSSSRQSWDEVAGIAASYPGVFASVGLHPNEIEDSVDLVSADKLLAYARTSDKIIAIGETGLDYHYENFSKTLQELSFRAHIEAARTAQLPLLIHNRDSDADMLRILSDEMGKGAFKGVLHCFTGTEDMARAALGMGFMLSAAGVITFPNAGALCDVFKTVPLDRLLVETDSPFLAPVPHRGKTNEPAFVVEVAKELARIKGITLAEMERALLDNSRKFFGLDAS